MSEICVDASVVVKLVFRGESYRNKVRKLLRDCVVNNVTLIAPAFFESEVDSAVRKRFHDGKLSTAEALRAYGGLDKVRVEILGNPRLRQRARDIAELFNQRTVYDSTYAALAELRGCEFWTADKAFYDAVKRKLTFVRYLPSYR